MVMLLEVIKDFQYSNDEEYKLLKLLNKSQRRAFRLKTWVLLKCDRKCHYCKKPLDYLTVTIEHLIPRFRGGTDDKDNLVAACAPCNNGHKNPLDFPDFYTDKWLGCCFPHA
jgi:5-methylcytosine-specific restriction endonuclease McrA